MQNMKMKHTTILVMVLLFGLSVTAGAWCIIRDTGSTEIPAGSGLWLQNCCSGNPRIWQDADQPVPIAILNSTPADIQPDVRDAHDEWTNLTASTFAFSNGGTTTIDTRTNDGTNVVGFDPNYCTARGNCGEGVLASSGCSSSGSGSSSYHAVDCDIFYNAEEYNWGHGAGDRDPYPVCLHELGHNAGLVHPSDTPRRSGSRGCGPDANSATMWYLSHANSGTLELDDWMGISSIYPEWTYYLHIQRNDSSPIFNAVVTLDNTCFAHDGSDYNEGGQVYGDIDFCLIGNGTDEDTYDRTTTYNSNASGNTAVMRVLHQNFCFTVEKAGFDTYAGCVTLPGEGNWHSTITLNDTDKRDIRAGDDLITHEHIIMGGDLNVTGTVYSSKGFVDVTDNGKDGARLVPLEQSSSAVMVHRSTARLTSGMARISFPTALRVRMDEGAYHVRVTATEDCNGLFVAEKGKDYFVVKEIEDGDSNASFNWELSVPRILENNSVPYTGK